MTLYRCTGGQWGWLLIDRSVAYHLGSRPLGKVAEAIKEKQQKKKCWGNGVDLSRSVLFLKGSTGSENTRLYSKGEEKKSPFMLLKISEAHTKVASERATAGIFVVFAVI